MTAEQDALPLDLPDPVPVDPPAPAPGLSADRRRTLRQRAAVDRGVHPLTGTRTHPERGTCGTCAFRFHADHHGRAYPKCSLGAPPGRPVAGPYVTAGAATDVRAWWPMCDYGVPKTDVD